MKSIKEAFSQIKIFSGLMCSRGWVEGSSGNLSFNISDDVIKTQKEYVSTGKKIVLPFLLDGLSGKIVILSSSGSRFRNFSNPKSGDFCTLSFDDSGKDYSFIKIRKLAESLKPTSEAISHLMIHDYLFKSKPDFKWILHVHPDEVIILSHLYTSKRKNIMNKDLLGVNSEFPAVIPEGAGYVPDLTPGSVVLAKRTLREIKQHRIVLWEKHGCIAIGKSLEEAFDLVDYFVKAARILITLKK